MALWVCINVSGLRLTGLAKMGSARWGPHKANGVMRHIFNQAFPPPVRPLCHLSHLHRHLERPTPAGRNPVRLMLLAVDMRFRAE